MVIYDIENFYIVAALKDICTPHEQANHFGILDISVKVSLHCLLKQLNMHKIIFVACVYISMAFI